MSFDFDVVSKDEFIDTSCAETLPKTYMHIPYLYYLRSDLPIDWYLTSAKSLLRATCSVKSCNRCGRFFRLTLMKTQDT